jgi:hypothetical protein
MLRTLTLLHQSFFCLFRLALLRSDLDGVGSSVILGFVNFFMGVRLTPVLDEDFLGVAFLDVFVASDSSSMAAFWLASSVAIVPSSIIGSGCVMYAAKDDCS